MVHLYPKKKCKFTEKFYVDVYHSHIFCLVEASLHLPPASNSTENITIASSFTVLKIIKLHIKRVQHQLHGMVELEVSEGV